MAQENHDINTPAPVPEGKDDDSIISDRCWEEMYRGDSRKWLTFDGSRKKTDPSICSTMKETYRIPRRGEEVSHIGRRRELLLQKFLDEATAEIVRERDEPPPVEEYCTEYDGNYNLPGFEPEKEPHSKNVELYEKYPLYSTTLTSFWNFKLKQSPSGEVSLPGLTKVADYQAPFKRNCRFTKYITEAVDDGKV